MLWEVLRNHDTGSITWLLVYHLVAVLKEFMVKPKNRKATVQKDLYSKRKGLFCCIHECIPSFCKAWFLISSHIIIEFSSVAQSCSTPCDPMNCSTPGLPVHHQLLESTQTTVHWVGDAIQPSHPLSSPLLLLVQSLPASGSFQMSQLFTSGGRSIGVSASTSVLPMNTQDWPP